MSDSDRQAGSCTTQPLRSNLTVKNLIYYFAYLCNNFYYYYRIAINLKEANYG